MKSIKNKNMSNNKSSRKLSRKSPQKLKVKNNTTDYFVQKTMDYLATIKIFHWTTDSYSTHKATDSLHQKLQELMDTFVETSLGHFNNKKSLVGKINNIKVNKITTDKELHNYTLEYKEHLRNIRNSLSDVNESEIITVVDAILTELDILLYLISL